jgi:hypothetical protein
MVEEMSTHVHSFEAMTRSFGPAVAHRNLARLVGDATASEVRHAYEQTAGAVTRSPGTPPLRERRLEEPYSGPREGDLFWPALKAHLLGDPRWSASMVETLDRESTELMRCLAPGFGPANAKGLVVGEAPSGTTATRSASIAKAADIGFRLILVLAGEHERERRRTERQLHADLVHPNDRVKPEWHTLTLPNEDAVVRDLRVDPWLDLHGHQRMLLVVKRRAPALGRLILWLSAAQPRLLEACPALLIDDEAAASGLGTGAVAEDEQGAIHQRIAELRTLLPKSAYVGYAPRHPLLVSPFSRQK